MNALNKLLTTWKFSLGFWRRRTHNDHPRMDTGRSSFKFKWPRIENIRSESFRTRFTFAQNVTNWDKLLKSARDVQSMECCWEEDVGFGGVHLVRIVTFIDGVQWLARVTIPNLWSASNKGFLMTWTDDDRNWMQSEIDTMKFVQIRSDITVPKIFAYDITMDNSVGMPYMFLQLIYGNSIRDLSVDIPDACRKKVFLMIASIHVCFLIPQPANWSGSTFRIGDR